MSGTQDHVAKRMSAKQMDKAMKSGKCKVGSYKCEKTEKPKKKQHIKHEIMKRHFNR